MNNYMKRKTKKNKIPVKRRHYRKYVKTKKNYFLGGSGLKDTIQFLIRQLD